MLREALKSCCLCGLFLAFAGCSQEAMLERVAPPEDRAFAERSAGWLIAGEFDGIEKVLDPSMRRPSIRADLGGLRELLPAGDPTSVALVGAHRTAHPDGVITDLTFEHAFPEGWALINVVVHRQGDEATIVSLTVSPRETSLEELHGFSLADKTPLHYLVFALAVFLPILTLYALVVCVKTPLRGRKWPWVLFILLGFGTFAVDWTSGNSMLQPLSVRLFSAAAFAPWNGPWTVAVSLPVGALVFLILRKRLARRLDTTETATAEPPPSE